MSLDTLAGGKRFHRRRDLPARRLSLRSVLRLQPHRLPKRATHFGRLAAVPPEILEQVFPERVPAVLLERHALGVELPADVRQLDALVPPGIADEALGILAGGDGLEVVEQALAQQGYSAIAPCPTQAVMSWLTTWLVIQRPFESLTGAFQNGMLFCS